MILGGFALGTASDFGEVVRADGHKIPFIVQHTSCSPSEDGVLFYTTIFVYSTAQPVAEERQHAVTWTVQIRDLVWMSNVLSARR